MINRIFSAVAEMSLTGTYIILAVLIIRAVMKRLPKRFSYMLWAIPAVRLLCPFTIPSAVSIFNLIKPAQSEKRIAGTARAVSGAVPTFNAPPAEYIPHKTAAVNHIAPSSQSAAVSSGFKPDIGEIAAMVWLAVAIGIVIYCAVCYVKMCRTLKGSRRDGEYYISSKIESPLVFGFIRPKIYLTEGLSEADARCILAHERTHIRRHDHIVKLACIPIAAIHWFNPLVWIGISRMNKDMELSCDEAAISTLGSESKKDYAGALLNMALKQNRISLCGVLCFGEKNIKSRIKGVLNMKKPKITAIVAAVAAVAVSAVCLLTSAMPEKPVDIAEIVNTETVSIPEIKNIKALSYSEAQTNVCLSNTDCGDYQFSLVAEKAYKDSEKSADSIYVSKLKLIGKLPDGGYCEQELPGGNITLKSSEIESYLTVRMLNKPLLVFNSPSDRTVYLYTVTPEDGFVQMGEPISFEKSPVVYRSLCCDNSWDSNRHRMYDHENNIRYEFNFRKFTYKIKYDYLDAEDAIAQYIESQVTGDVISADIAEIGREYDCYELAWYYDEEGFYVKHGDIYKGVYILNHPDKSTELKSDFFIISRSSSGAVIDKVIENDIKIMTGTFKREAGYDGDVNIVFHSDNKDAVKRIMGRQCYDMLTWHSISEEYGTLGDTPDGTRAVIGYVGDKYTTEGMAYIHLLL